MTQAVTDRPATPAKVPMSAAVAHRRKVRRHRGAVLMTQVAIIVAVIGLWEFASGRFIEELMISKPSKIFPTFWEWIGDGTLLENATITFRSAGIGLAIGGIVGVAVGVLLGQSRALAETFEPFITALYTLPKQALIPLFIMWVGIGPQLSVLTASVIAFFLIFFNTFFGIKDVRQSLVSSVRIMGGGPVDVMWRVRLPSALIWVVAALKIAVPQTIVGVVIAEMLAGNEGLGHLVALNAGLFNSAGTYAALLALLLAGFLVDRLMNLIVKKPLEWKNTASTM